MSDEGEFWRDVTDHKKRVRAAYGVECPECKRLQPKRSASILLPHQRCRVDGYVDPRPDITREQLEAV